MKLNSLALVLVGCLAVNLVCLAAESGAGQDGVFASDWIVVRLVDPIGKPDGNGDLPTTTGRLEVDELIAETGIYRIDHAFKSPATGAASQVAHARHGIDRTYRFHVPHGSGVVRLAERFSLLEQVEYAEPDPVGTGGARFPNDTYLENQWGLHQLNDADVDAPEAWDIGVGAGQIIAVLDTGADSDHPDFAGKLIAGYDFVNGDANPEDDHGHGSNVSAIASAATDNATGLAGACWNCSIMPLKVLDSNNSGFYSWWASAIIYATDNGARVINLSAGGSSSSATLQSAVQYAYDAGVIHVSITHNDNAGFVRYPGRYAETITVGATDDVDLRAAPFCYSATSGSNYGPEIDFVAPGELILGVAMGGGYNFWCGTSQAAPLVAGLVGVMRTLYPSVGREEARHLISAGAEDGLGRPGEDTAGFDFYHGWGRVNMDRTLRATRSTVSLRVEGKANTRILFAEANPLASSYDFVRGQLESLSESAAGVNVGPVVCLVDDAVDPDTSGSEDNAVPDPGSAFFYLARFNAAPGAGSYGGSSTNRDRAPSSGGCGG